MEHPHSHLKAPITATHCSHASPSSVVSPATSTFTGSAARTTQIRRTQSPVRFASLQSQEQVSDSSCTATTTCSRHSGHASRKATQVDRHSHACIHPLWTTTSPARATASSTLLPYEPLPSTTSKAAGGVTTVSSPRRTIT